MGSGDGWAGRHHASGCVVSVNVTGSALQRSRYWHKARCLISNKHRFNKPHPPTTHHPFPPGTAGWTDCNCRRLCGGWAVGAAASEGAQYWLVCLFYKLLLCCNNIKNGLQVMMFRGRDYAVVSDIIHSEMQGQRKWHLHFLPIHWAEITDHITCHVDLCRARSWRRRVWKDLAPSQNQFTSTPHWRGVSSHQPALATTGPSLLHTGTSTHTERHAGECCTSVVCIKYENTPPPPLPWTQTQCVPRQH